MRATIPVFTMKELELLLDKFNVMLDFDVDDIQKIVVRSKPAGGRINSSILGLLLLHPECYQLKDIMKPSDIFFQYHYENGVPVIVRVQDTYGSSYHNQFFKAMLELAVNATVKVSKEEWYGYENIYIGRLYSLEDRV